MLGHCEREWDTVQWLSKRFPILAWALNASPVCVVFANNVGEMRRARKGWRCCGGLLSAATEHGLGNLE